MNCSPTHAQRFRHQLPAGRAVCLAALVSPLISALAATGGFAQDDQPNGEAQTDTPVLTDTLSDASVDTVRVLGSHIRAQAGRGDHTLDRSAIDRLGVEDLTTALARISANIGSESNTDSVTQNDTSGTANVNLRGLGLDATLVMLDGVRMTVSSVAADDGSTFVDTNALVPTIAIGAVEVMANGGSALYGSDAVAGVVNVVTRDGFAGLEFTGERRLATEYGTDGSDTIVQAIAGHQGHTWSAIGAVSWFERQSLEGTDTPFTPGTGVSALGQPGAYAVVDPTNPGDTVTIIDRDCEAGGGIPLVLGDPIDGLGTPGFCRLDFAQFFSLVNNEQRFQAYADMRADLGFADGRVQLTFADNAVERGNSPSLPDLSFPTLPAGNPGNYFGEDVVWYGRPRGVEAGSARRKFDHETFRILGALDGGVRLGERDWDWSTALSYSRNGVRTTITDHLRDRLDAAIAGFGGPDCPVSDPAMAASLSISPGDQTLGCYWFNPFGSGGLVTDTADPRFNDPVVLDDILGEDIRKSRTDLLTVDALITGADIMITSWADMSGALGVHARRETTATDHGADFNAENFLFIIGGPDFSGERSAIAAFGELMFDTAADVTVQLAGRYEDVDGASAFSPRVEASWTPSSVLTLSASASRSFRAASLNETVSASTTLESLPIGDQNLVRAVTTFGSDDLTPETSTAFSARAAYATPSWRTSATAWRYEVEDLIVEENARAIVAADLEDGQFDNPAIELTPTGEVRRVNANFVNAPQVVTQGVDLAAGLTRTVAGGRVVADLTATYVHEYTLTDPVTGENVSAEGSRNFNTFARSLPQWRARSDTSWTRGAHTIGLGAVYVGPYDNDQNPETIDELLTVNAQYSVRLGASASASAKSTRVTIGVNDAFNAGPPLVTTQLGYDTKTHDPRGRVAYVRLSQRF